MNKYWGKQKLSLKKKMMSKSWVRELFLAIGVVCLANCMSSDLNQAELMVRQGKFYLAIEHYLSFAKKHPQDLRAAQALFKAGNVQQMMLNEPKKALETYQQLVTHFPVNEFTLEAQERIADLYNNTFNDYQQAIIEYEKLLKIAPHHDRAPRAWFSIAQNYTMLRNYRQAELEYQALIKSYPQYENLDEVHYQLGNNAYIAEDYPVALGAYQVVLQEYPSSPFYAQALFGLASTYEEMDNFEEAEKFYKKSLDIYPTPQVVEIRLKGMRERKQKKAFQLTITPNKEGISSYQPQ